jgi:hypothetical protein
MVMFPPPKKEAYQRNTSTSDSKIRETAGRHSEAEKVTCKKGSGLTIDGRIENLPSNILGEQCDLALLFKKLATLRTDDDALLVPGPNFKTLTSTLSISFDSHRLDDS